MGGGETTSTTEVHSYYYYVLELAHTNIVPSEVISLYNNVGDLVYTIPANSSYVNYGSGIISVPGNDQQSTIESISTASYYVYYSTGDLVIDYDKVEFKINKTIIRNPNQFTVAATFEYFSVVTAVKDIGSVIDGRWDTQVQTIFYAQPPTGYNYAIINLGAIYEIQAVDIIAGFFKPEEDPNMKFDIDMRISLQYSLDNISYFEISDTTNNIRIGGGESLSFDEDDLGTNFSCKYIKIILEDVKKVEYTENGVYPVAFTEVSAYEDIVIKSEAKLIKTTKLTQAIDINEIGSGETYTINVESTEGFADPSSGIGQESAYIEEDEFLYTGRTATSFTGCSGLSQDHAINQRVTTEIASDTLLYDDYGLLDKLGDRLYKSVRIDDNTLYTQSELDRLSKAFLKEFVKDHSKIVVNLLYCPFINVGHTLRVVDPYNNTATNYFVESVHNSNGIYELVIAKYPL